MDAMSPAITESKFLAILLRQAEKHCATLSCASECMQTQVFFILFKESYAYLKEVP